LCVSKTSGFRSGPALVKGGLTAALLAGGLAMAGCAEMGGPTAGPPPPPPPPPSSGIVIQTPFRAEDFAWSATPGTAGIRGLTSPNQSCAGNAVALTPDTAYSRERIGKLYGAVEYAIVPTAVVRARAIANDNPAMRGYVRGSRCDSNGGFAFDGLPAGSFFIIVEVGDPSGPKVVMRRVTTVAGRLLQAPLTGTAGAAPGPSSGQHRRRSQAQ
jgi:hypothetical protein